MYDIIIGKLDRCWNTISNSNQPVKASNKMTEHNSTCVASAMQIKTERFIERSKTVHFEKYDYTATKYINAHNKVKIFCHHCQEYFYQRAYAHLQGQGCGHCARERASNTKRRSNDEFIALAQKRHGIEHYNYSAVEYVSSDRYVKIYCNVHCEYFKQKPNNHLSGQGCAKCAGCAKYTNAEFIEKVKLVHSSASFDYSKVNYQGAHKKIIIICKEHGEFETRPNWMLSGSGCIKCGRKKTASKLTMDFKEFMNASKRVHEEKFSYDAESYTKVTDKVKICCSIHGWFWQLGTDHLGGHGCARCSKALNGFARSNFANICIRKQKQGTLYLIRCQKDEEVFYKVGITSCSIAQRFNKTAMPYSYELLLKIKGEGSYIYDLETRIHQLLSKEHYMPKIEFKGSKYECFKVIPQSVLSLLRKLKSTDQLSLIA